ELEELGYSALWVPDVGGNLFEVLERLLGATNHTTIATGILNLWFHEAAGVAETHARFVETFGPRLLLGIGVSHQMLIDSQEAGRYQRPLSAMRTYLDGLDGADPSLDREYRVLAALGPKMLELARDRAAGCHPYNVTPDHTRLAREAVGPDALVLPEQAVALTSDADQARQLGRAHLAMYLNLPNYANNIRRLGFGDEDFADGGSDRMVDALVAWGDEAAIMARVQEHRDAGADHVCLQVLSEAGMFPREEWRRLAPV
ncbi:MAG: LLM class F420-dependent oxidoreductase, partial [Acidimicrobiales bacterium]